MQLSAVILARIFAFIEPVDLNPRGLVSYPELVSALVERYGFAKYPKTAEDFDETKGVKFEMGRVGEITIQSVQIYNVGIVVDTASSTNDSETVLVEALSWLSEKYRLQFKPSMISRRAYVSSLTFYSDVGLVNLNPAISKLAQRVSNKLPEYFKQQITYEPTTVILGFDGTKVKQAPALFSIERRAEVPFSENKYFSTAPLPTDDHIAALEEFEAGLKGQPTI